jgi:hypothetical protein
MDKWMDGWMDRCMGGYRSQVYRIIKSTSAHPVSKILIFLMSKHVICRETTVFRLEGSRRETHKLPTVQVTYRR